MPKSRGRSRQRASRSPKWLSLAEKAVVARREAYAPYSDFRVGAALLTASGKTWTGANVENASYGLSICAERVAVTKAVTAGDRDFRALVVVTQSNPPSPPCGLCLQTLVEFAPDLPILLLNPRGVRVETSLRALFPGSFTRALLES